MNEYTTVYNIIFPDGEVEKFNWDPNFYHGQRVEFNNTSYVVADERVHVTTRDRMFIRSYYLFDVD